jgi:hypothetical protein
MLIKIIVLILILFATFIICTEKIFTTRVELKNNYDVDIVYTWVKDDEHFNIEKSNWARMLNYKNVNQKDRFKENQELKYSLRSLVKNFPYFRNIYIVVKDGQVPTYLQFNNNLNLINHSTIIENHYLPTFNSMAIEACIHKIPNLSEYYLYFNDDLMILKNLTIEYFIDEKGLPYMFDHTPLCNKNFDENKLDNYTFGDGQNFNNYLLDIIDKVQDCRSSVAHVPKMWRRSFDYIIEDKLKQYYYKFPNNTLNIYDLTINSKFRKNNNLYLNAFIKPYLYKSWFGCKSKPSSEIFISLQKDKTINHLLNSKEYFCVINEGFEDVSDKEISNYFKVMETLYPEKSIYEI